MNYSNSSINLSDSISGYITATEDDCDNTQYLSVLSQDVTLEEMNVTLTNGTNGETNGNLVHIENNSEPFLFNVDGTNEIYSVQVAQDEDGNLQKYQIQYSGNINGELTPMMETIQFLPMEYEEVVSEENLESSDNFVIANEQLIPNDFNPKHSTEQGAVADHGWTISPVNSASFEVPIKTEHENYYDQSSILGTVCEEPHNSIDAVHIETNPEISDDMGTNDSENDIIPVEHLEIKHCIDQEELYEETIGENDFEHLYLENSYPKSNGVENHTSESNTVYLGNNLDQNVDCILKESIDQPKTNILKKSSQRNLLKDFLTTEQRIVYVQTLSEKENMKAVDIESFIKPSSRSLLKSNQSLQAKQTDSNLNKNLSKSTTVKGPKGGSKPNQSYCRTKESKQARQFMNFINSTTIPQVPERKERLPRKQQIKPLIHQDEDIIVKEMIVSSKGFVEPVSAKEIKQLPVTEYVELTDSGDESHLLNGKQKKRKGGTKEKLIEISDSEDSCETESEAGNPGVRKKRGRPLKSRNNIQNHPNSPPKISRIDSEVEDVTSTLQVIRMENEKKHEDEKIKSGTENIKKTEEKEKIVEKNANKQKETLKTDTKSKVTQNVKESIWKNGFDYKFECEKCKVKFINKFLLSRHQCIDKIGTNFPCDICKQKFPNTSSLNLHKKTHNKESTTFHLSNTKTTKTKTIPEKNTATTTFAKPSLLTSRYSSVAKPPIKIPTRPSLLPSKTTKPPSSVKTARLSTLPVKTKRLTMPLKTVPGDRTLKKNDVPDIKTMNPVESKGTEEKIEKDTFKPPVIQVTPEKTADNNTFKCERQCDKCSKSFGNNTLWFEHQVLSHGFKTPDKSIGEKKTKKFVRDKVIHNGIRAAPTLAKSFSLLRNKVQHM